MILPLVALLLWCIGLMLILRIPRCSVGEDGIQPGEISVIIPARNEERNLPRLLRSISIQDHQPMEILVVDDDSTDSTARVGEEYGARVIKSRPLPMGWRGKTWACHQGAEEARGRYLLFMDADTFFMDGGLEAVAGSIGKGVLSIAPYHEVSLPYENLSLFFNLVMIMGTGAFTIMGDRVTPSGLFGQFMLVSAVDYRKAGGHGSVRREILENFFLARYFRRFHVPLRCRGGRGVLGIRMYPDGLKELISGWSKAFVSGAAEAPATLTILIAAWLTGAVLSFIMTAVTAFKGGTLIWPYIYMLYTIHLWSMQKRTGSFNTLWALAYPVPLLFYFWVFFRALFLRSRHMPVEWKGRMIGSGEGGD